MSEPATASAVAGNLMTGVITGSGMVTILGMQTGLDCPTLLAGLAGGAVALSYLEPAKPLKQALSVLSAAILAGYLAPPIAKIGGMALGHVPFIAEAVSADAIMLGVAFAIGYLAHGVVLPGMRKIGTALVGKYQ